MHHFVNWFLGTSSRMFVYICAIYVMCTCMYACMYCMYVHTYLCMYIAMYACTYASRLMIVSREAKKKQRPLSELFTWTTTKKLGNAQAKPPWKLAPSYYKPNKFLLPRINKPIMVEITSIVLKFGYCEFNGGLSHSHVWKTIPFPLLYKINTLKVPSIYTESISPTMKWSITPCFSGSLLRSLLCDSLYKAPVVFLSFFVYFLLLLFIAHFFCEHQSLREPPGYKFT